MKKSKNIPSYSFEELSRSLPKRNILMLLESGDETYNQIKISDEEFDQICKIINNSKIGGFSVSVYGADFKIEEVDNDNE